MIAARLSAAEAESSLSGQVGPLGDVALIRGHGEGFSSLASWLVLRIALVAPLSCACPGYISSNPTIGEYKQMHPQ